MRLKSRRIIATRIGFGGAAASTEELRLMTFGRLPELDTISLRVGDPAEPTVLVLFDPVDDVPRPLAAVPREPDRDRQLESSA